MTNDPSIPQGMSYNSDNMSNRNGVSLPPNNMVGIGNADNSQMLQNDIYHYPSPNTYLSHVQTQHSLHQPHHAQVNVQNGQQSQFQQSPHMANNVNNFQTSGTSHQQTYIPVLPHSQVPMGVQNNRSPTYGQQHHALPINLQMRNKPLYGAGVTSPIPNGNFPMSGPHHATYSVTTSYYTSPNNNTYPVSPSGYSKPPSNGNGMGPSAQTISPSAMEINNNKPSQNNRSDYLVNDNLSTKGEGGISGGKRSKTGTNGRWTQEEHLLFLQGLKLYSKDWRKIQAHVGTRTLVQIRSHAQKYNQKLATINKKTKGAIVVITNGSEVDVNLDMMKNIKSDEGAQSGQAIDEKGGTRLESALELISGSVQDDSCNNLHHNIINDEGLVLMDGKRLSLKKRKGNQSTTSQGRGRRRNSLNSGNHNNNNPRNSVNGVNQVSNDNIHSQIGRGLSPSHETYPLPYGNNNITTFNQSGNTTQEKAEFGLGQITNMGHTDKGNTSQNILPNTPQTANLNSYPSHQFVTGPVQAGNSTASQNVNTSLDSGIEKGLSGTGPYVYPDSRFNYPANPQLNDAGNIEQKFSSHSQNTSNSGSPKRSLPLYQYNQLQLYHSHPIINRSGSNIDMTENEGALDPSSPKRNNHTMNISIFDVNTDPKNTTSYPYNEKISPNTSQLNLQTNHSGSPSNRSLNSNNLQGDINSNKYMSSSSLCGISRNSSSNNLNNGQFPFYYAKEGYPSPLSGSPTPGHPYSNGNSEAYENGGTNMNNKPLCAPSSFSNLYSYQGHGQLYATGVTGETQNPSQVTTGENSSNNTSRNNAQGYNNQPQNSMYIYPSSYPTSRPISVIQNKLEGNEQVNRTDMASPTKRNSNPVTHHSSHPRLDPQQACSLHPGDNVGTDLNNWSLDSDSETIKYEDDVWSVTQSKRKKEDATKNVHCSLHTMNFSATGGMKKEVVKEGFSDLKKIDDDISNWNAGNLNSKDQIDLYDGSIRDTFTVILNPCSPNGFLNSRDQNGQDREENGDDLKAELKEASLFSVDKDNQIHSSATSTSFPFISANGNFYDSISEEKGSTPNAFVSSMKMNLAEKILDGDKFLNKSTDSTIIAEKQKGLFQQGNDIDDLETVPHSETDSVTSFFLPEKVDEMEEVKLQSFYFFLDYNDNSDMVRQRLN